MLYSLPSKERGELVRDSVLLESEEEENDEVEEEDDGSLTKGAKENAVLAEKGGGEMLPKLVGEADVSVITLLLISSSSSLWMYVQRGP